MDIEDLIRGLAQVGNIGVVSIGGKDDAGPGKQEVDKLLQDYLKGTDNTLKRGDKVRRNLLGQERYKQPENNSYGVVVHKYDKHITDQDGMPCDMLIAVAPHKGVVLTFLVDSAYYTQVDGPSNVTPIKRM